MEQFSLIGKLVKSLHIENDNPVNILEINKMQDQIKFDEYHKISVIVVNEVIAKYAVSSAIRGLSWIAGGSTKLKSTGDYLMNDGGFVEDKGQLFQYVFGDVKAQAFFTQLSELVKACKLHGEESVYVEYSKTNVSFA